VSGTILTIGLFDGVHLGHQAVIRQVVEEGRRLGLESAVVTFDRHPAEVLQPGSGPLLLTDPETKEQLLLELGVDQVIMIEFTKAFAGLTPMDFLEDVIAPLEPAEVMVGRDFRFGKSRAGDVRMLEDFARRRGF
jgi:riboflavin kinase / FMN adenylyltransferase